MTELGRNWEREDLGGGRFRHTQHLRHICYQQGGLWRRIVSDWADGDASFPHVVSQAGLRVRTAPNGDRRILPIQDDDNAWFSISSPYIQIAGNWTQPSLGAFSRQGNLLQATSANVDTYIWHVGHFIKAGFLLKGGWQPTNGQFAFRVGLNGLTRQGGQLFYNGQPVMRLRAPVVYDWDNPDDTRQIAHDFVQLAGQNYILFTLPSLAGMVRPVVDPTLELQPDETDGKDTRIIGGTAPYPSRNFGVSITVRVGMQSGYVQRTLIQFDLSSLSPSVIVTSATLSMYCNLDNSLNARTFRAYRMIQAWVEGTGDNTESGDGATWNTYDGVNNWTAAGGFHSSDCEQTDIGNRNFTATETLNEFKNWVLTASEVQDWVDGSFANNGMMVKADTENEDQYEFASSDTTPAANRPKLVVEYTLAGNPWYYYAQQ